MNRRDAIRYLGIGAAAAVVVPEVLAATEPIAQATGFGSFPIWPAFKLWHTAGRSPIVGDDTIRMYIHIATEVKHEYAGKVTFTSHRESCEVTGEYHDSHTITDAMDRLMYGIDEVTRFRRNAGT